MSHTPAFGLAKKFQSLHGREAHSTPIVVNLTDDNGDGAIDADDIPDIVVPVEAIGDQLKGEIKAISGDDGRELFTAGGPNLVSPWSELAAADIDGDGMPEIVARAQRRQSSDRVRSHRRPEVGERREPDAVVQHWRRRLHRRDLDRESRRRRRRRRSSSARRCSTPTGVCLATAAR